MAGVLLLQDFILNNQLRSFKISGEKSQTTIRFSLNDILYHQRRISSVWRMLNRNNANPVAKTFLGRVVSISFDE